jgi:pyridinium-3,5-biscarboxylic acid mononucleotide sulfurtransferase
VLERTNEKFSNIVCWFLKNSDTGVIVALSGGVDSSVVALAAKKAFGNKALAITANYKTLSEEEISSAIKVAKEINIKHKVIDYNELENLQFVANDKLRCYYCRKELTNCLLQESKELGINLIVDGTHVDDLSDTRPGIRALRENGIRSPLQELGLHKTEVRSIAEFFGISIYNKPSNSCLASRIPQGTKITYEKLRRIEMSEIVVKKIFNVDQVRVRDHGDVARVEVGSNELAKLFDIQKLDLLDSELKELGFRFVSIDARGYRTGNLIVVR